jgi:hypothetical protein
MIVAVKHGDQYMGLHSRTIINGRIAFSMDADFYREQIIIQ